MVLEKNMKKMIGMIVVLIGLGAFAGTSMAEGEPGKWSKAGEEIKEAAAAVGDATKESTGEAWKKTKDVIRDAMDATAETSRKVWDATREGSKKAWDASKEKSREMWGEGKGKLLETTTPKKPVFWTHNGSLCRIPAPAGDFAVLQSRFFPRRSVFLRE